MNTSRWLRVALVAVLLVAVLGVGGLYLVTGIRFNTSYSIQPPALEIPSDPASLTRGEETAQFLYAGCHGADMRGQVLSESVWEGRAAAPNLTGGQGGIGASYSDLDWARAILHGVGPDGRPLIGMPSDRFGLSGASLGELIAYLKNLPPVDHDVGRTTVGLTARFNFLTGRDPLLAAELIDHEALLLSPDSLFAPPDVLEGQE